MASSFAIKLPGFRRIDMLQEMFVTGRSGEQGNPE